LDHFNGLHIRDLSNDELAKQLMPQYLAAGVEPEMEFLTKIMPLIQTRLATLDDAPALTAFLFIDEIQIETEAIPGKGMDFKQTRNALEKSLELMEGLPAFEAELMDSPMRELADELGLKAGQLFTSLRNAVTGQQISPPLFESMELLGKERTFARINQAISKLS
jgi:glutamyl-tRNA synthetase